MHTNYALLFYLIQQKTKTYPPRVLPLDLADLDSMPSKAEEALSLHGSVDILINNGGISFRGVAVDTKMEVDQRIMLVNYFGAVALTKGKLIRVLSLMGLNMFIQFMHLIASGHLIADVAQLKRHQWQDEISKCPGCLLVNSGDSSKPGKTNVTLGISSTRNAER